MDINQPLQHYAKLNDEGKKVWAYTKNEISGEQNEMLKEEQEKRKQIIAEL